MDIGEVNQNGVNVIASENNSLGDVITLNSVEDRQPLLLEDNKVVITNKIAEIENLKIGDLIEYTDARNEKYFNRW